MILTYLYCVLGVAKYRGDWGWEKQKRASRLVLIYSSSSWTKYRFYTMVPLHLLIRLVASISSCMWLLCIAARDCALRPFYCSPFPCDNGMMNQSGDFACSCLFLCLIVFVASALSRRLSIHSRSIPYFPPHHCHCHSLSPPSSLLLSRTSAKSHNPLTTILSCVQFRSIL